MYRAIIYLIIWVTLFPACNQRKDGRSGKSGLKPVSAEPRPQENKTVALLPFTGTGKNLTELVKKGLEANLKITVTVMPEADLPANAYYQPRQRYIADSLLVWLNAANKNRTGKIIGLTTRDISTRKGDIANWGILGLGSCPGTACVISSFRAGKKKVAKVLFEKRMVTLALHELGHTYGLKHCPDPGCLMKDAEGKMNLDDAVTYCGSCKKLLLVQDVLK